MYFAKCGKCGNAVSGDDRFCRNCGSPIPTPQSGASSIAVDPAAAPPVSDLALWWGLMWRTYVVYMVFLAGLAVVLRLFGWSLSDTLSITMRGGGSAALIKASPAILSLLFAASLAFFLRAKPKGVLFYILGTRLRLSDTQWKRCHIALIGTLIIAAFIHAVAAATMSEVAWVNFKLFGAGLINIVLMILVVVWTRRAG